MNVAVSSDGNTILATSMGSTKITQARLVSGSYTLSYIEVDEPSWGVAFVHPLIAILTHPGSTILSVLTRATTSSNFNKDRDIVLGDQFRYSTELIAKPGTKVVYVANRGMPLSGQGSWTNAVFRVNVDSDQITGTMVTEREPRALTLSPNANRLYVGHIQGALGGVPLTTNNP
ncbi:MAG TPA: hypothetical protein VFU38_06695, partial [Candidatus Krumholzibacteria bacterium]|nr:hypothetical protein [Candidatus Krumholzibacteria bacterium]